MRQTHSNKTPWTKEEFDLAWEQIPVNVQPILIVLARRPHGYRIEALQEHLSTQPQRLRGLLGEVNRVHKQHRDKPRLWMSDRKVCIFTMDKAVASLISAQDDRWVPL